MAKQFNRAILIEGETLRVGNTQVTVFEYDQNEFVKRCEGASVPTGAGYALSCRFVLTTNGLEYINTGSSTSASFIARNTRESQSTAAASKCVPGTLGTIATTGDTDEYVIVPETGTLTGVDFSSLAGLAAHDSNYITFSITNLGQNGSGSTALLAATDANTTKATGGSALTANAKRSLTLHGTAGNLSVTAGDRLRIRASATGTLAGAVTGARLMLRFGGTT